MAHPHIDTVRDEVFTHRPRCMAYPPYPHADGDRPTRCPNQATVWLVAPTGAAIMRECAECAAAVLAEYDANQEALGGKWYSVPLRIEVGR